MKSEKKNGAITKQEKSEKKESIQKIFGEERKLREKKRGRKTTSQKKKEERIWNKKKIRGKGR